SPNITFNESTIERIKPKQAFRFLGCWFSISKKQTPIYNIIKTETANALTKLKKAKISDKQTIYIINAIIFTRISYRIQNTALLPTVYTHITNIYTNLVKHKAGLATSIPNLTIFHNAIYALKTRGYSKPATYLSYSIPTQPSRVQYINLQN
ncbi:13280_t:CDS:1, partial [Racocetra persica]